MSRSFLKLLMHLANYFICRSNFPDFCEKIHSVCSKFELRVIKKYRHPEKSVALLEKNIVNKIFLPFPEKISFIFIFIPLSQKNPGCSKCESIIQKKKTNLRKLLLSPLKFSVACKNQLPAGLAQSWSANPSQFSLFLPLKLYFCDRPTHPA